MARSKVEYESFDDCEARKETSKAFLVYIPDHDKEVWVPKSVIGDESDLHEEGDTGTLYVEGWFVEKEITK